MKKFTPLFRLNLQMFSEEDQKEDGKKQPDKKPQTAEEYIAAIENLKANSVSKEEYDKLKQENTQLIKAVAGEGPAPEGVQEQGKVKPNKAELQKKLLEAGETNLTNAEFVETALLLRKTIIDEGGVDPFLPVGAKISPQTDDILKADKTAEILQSCLDEARDEDGKVDPDIFNAVLKKTIADDSGLIAARAKASKFARK